MTRHSAAIGATLLVGIFYLLTLRQGHSWGDDFSMYIRHAKNLVEGVNYEETGYIYNPEQSIAPTAYPPIFPLLLVPIYQWFGVNLQLMKVEGVLFFVASLYLIFLIFKDDFANLYIIPGILLIGMNPFFWDHKDSISSDLAFIFFTYLCLYIIYKHFSRSQSPSSNLGSSLVTGHLIYLSYGTRSLGILLIPSLLIYDFLKNRRISLFSIQVVFIFFILVIIQTFLLHTSKSYTSQFFHTAHLLRIILRDLLMYIITVYDVFNPDIFFNNSINIVVSTALVLFTAVLAAAGFTSRAMHRLTIIEIFIPLYLAAIILWPFWEGLRFLFPLIPFYFFYMFVGIESIAPTPHQRIQHIASLGIILLISVLYVHQYSRMDFGPVHGGIAEQASVELFNFIKRQTHEQDVLIFVKPRALALYTGRSAAINHRPRDDAALWNFFRDIHATYLIIGPPGPLVGSSLVQDIALSLHPTTSVFSRGELRFLQQLVAKYPNDFQEVYTNAHFQVYKIMHRYGD